MHDSGIILTLTGGLAAALVLGFLARKIGLSPIVGYLLAGVAIGPHTPGFIADSAVAGQFAEIGVILLMFGVGLHFQVKDLLRVAKVAILGALIQIVSATVLGALVTHWFGWPLQTGIVFGIAISVASTVVLTRVLSDNRALHSPDGHIAIGWLVVEDIFTILVLVLLPIFFAPSHGDPFSLDGLAAIGLVFLKLGILFFLTFMFGTKVMTAILGFVSKVRSRELFTLTVLVMALGIAVGSSLLFGASMALGALLAGMIVGQSDYSTRAASEALPMRDAFAVLFFVSMGMMFDPTRIFADLPMTAAVLAIVVLGKPLFAFITVRLLGRSVASSLSISVALSQIGEFSFILATLAIELKVLPAESMNILVAVAIVAIALNPALYKLARKFADYSAKLERDRALAAETRIVIDALSEKMIVVGYGPVGRTLSRILIDNGFHVTVIEMNLGTVKMLRENNISVVYGDATTRETLTAAGVNDARGLIISTPDLSNDMLIATAKEINPNIHIICRSNYLLDNEKIRASGADAVFSGEGETALAMSTYLMRQLGSTDEHIDQERERVRRELFGS